MERYLLDTSAMIALYLDEEGASEVDDLLRRALKKSALVMASFMTFMEFFYGVWRSEGKEAALKSYLELKSLPVVRVDQTEEILVLAAEIKATHSLSLADSWVAATAIEQEAILVHKDPEFEPLSGRVELRYLPYKKS